MLQERKERNMEKAQQSLCLHRALAPGEGPDSAALLRVPASGMHRKTIHVPEKSWQVTCRTTAGTPSSVSANFSEPALQPGVAVKIFFFPFLPQCWLLLLDELYLLPFKPKFKDAF